MKRTVLTLGELSRRSAISPPTLRLYSDAGLIDCLYTSRGDRLFFEEAIEQARRVRESRSRKRSAQVAQTEAT